MNPLVYDEDDGILRIHPACKPTRDMRWFEWVLTVNSCIIMLSGVIVAVKVL